MSGDQLAIPHADGSALPAQSRCRAIPVDGEAPCTRPARGRAPRPGKADVHKGEQGEIRELCKEHDTERLKLYYKYKAASMEVEERSKAASDTSFKHPLRLNREQVEEAIAKCEAYGKAIEEELEGRESHKRRFILEVDDGHAAWLRTLQLKRATNNNVIEELRRRRDVLDADPARARIEGDQRRQAAEAATKRRSEEERAVAKKQQEEVERKQRRNAEREAEAERMREAAAAAWRQEEAERQQRQREEAERQQRQREEAERQQRQREAQEQAKRRLAAQQRAEAERARQLAAEQENARRVRAHNGPLSRETQPLLVGTGRSPQASPLYPQVPGRAANQPFVPGVPPQTVSITPRYGPDVERQDATLGRYSEEDESHCPGMFEMCFALFLGVCAFFVFVKIVG